MAIRKINSRSLGDTGVATADIADGSITTAKLAVDAVTTAKLADDAVTGAKLYAENLGRRNLIINGNFDVWQRGTTATYTTNSSKFITDRWMIRSTGVATVTSSQQSFTVGQTDVPNNPKYYYRWDITSYTSGTGLFHQRLEDVAKHSGQTLTFSFWAKCNSSQNLITSYRQYFGSGGSAAVDTSGSTFALTTSWQKFTETVSIPSASGKTISGGDDYLYVQFNMPGAVCTVDIAQCQLEVGDTATPFEHRSYAEELSLCQRYYQILISTAQSAFGPGRGASGGDAVVAEFPLLTVLRASPTVAHSGAVYVYDANSRNTSTPSSVTVSNPQAGANFIVLYYAFPGIVCDDDRVCILSSNGTNTLTLDSEM